MTNKSRVKGFTYERALVKEFNKYSNVYSERMWGSNGSTRGLPEEVDLILDYYNKTFHLQAKNYKWENIPAGFKSFCKSILTKVDVGVIKKEGMPIGKSLVVMELDTLLGFIEADNDDWKSDLAR